jgi:DNA-binding beta-propeller fold protein YncE
MYLDWTLPPRQRDAIPHSRFAAAVLILCALAVPASLYPQTGALDSRAGAAAAGAPIELRFTRTVAPEDSVALRFPQALCFDHRNDIIVADTGNHRVLVLSPDGKVIDEFGGYGWGVGQFDGPSDVAVYEGFYIYVLDEGNRRVVRYDLEGDYLDVLVPADEAGSPVSMAVDKSGGLLLVDSDTQSVLVFSQFEEALEPVGQFGLDEGGLVTPVAVAVGPAREIAVADPGRQAVLMFDEFGSPLRVLSAPDTLLPVDVVIDRRGNVIVADGHRDRVILFPPGGRRPLLSIEAGFRPTALGLSGSGEIAALNGLDGSVHFIELVYASNIPENRR